MPLRIFLHISTIAASSTATIGSHELTSRVVNEPPATAAGEGPGISEEARRLGSRYGEDYSDGDVESVAVQSASSEVVESWKYPRQNVFRTGATFWSLLTSGANDAAYGALNPYAGHYRIYYLHVGILAQPRSLSPNHGCQQRGQPGHEGSPVQASFARVTWLCAAFLLCYVGVGVSVGGWIVQFMIRVRQAENYPAGMTSIGFWFGLAVGRAILGTIGFAAAFGGNGAAILPFAVCAIAQAKGVKTLQQIILAFLTALLGLWLCLPRIGKKRD
ncbi:hypothetical protein FGADI_88 [Fusarium gaditjirri]|uniref:Uncharacterized protein n=1 Tax=Fusarium gaditjirri TaxID=282569 RepID=A0A8H4TPK1_9HYPO|nr:hypothetical protein FGADI_88 [Fusarium gaditjirri]